MMPILGFIKCWALIHISRIKIAKLFKEHVYVFFCNALYIHRSGPFQNGAKHHVLVFYCFVHPPARWQAGLHLFETALNGHLFWAFDKKRHTHAPSWAPRHSFWNWAKPFMNLFSKSGQNRSHKAFYEWVKRKSNTKTQVTLFMVGG